MEFDRFKGWQTYPQTFVSFRHSCFPTSRLQKARIGHQFGLYQMMSGAQYKISYLRILESQRQLKVSNILKLFSQQNESELSLKRFIQTFTLSLEESTEVS